MELRPYNISVTLSLPPDTDTPGFAVEELSKPLETKLISQTSELIQPDVVADKLFKDALVSIRKTMNFPGEKYSQNFSRISLKIFRFSIKFLKLFQKI